MSLQDELIQANELGRTIAQLMAQPMPRSSNTTQAIDGLIMSLTGKAQELLSPLLIKESSPPAGEAGAGDSQPLAAYTGHASDCSTNNRGVPETVGDCDCGAGLTLESYFKDNQARGVIDFSLRACHLPDGEVGFYLHPGTIDGHIPQFTVKGNVLTTHTPA